MPATATETAAIRTIPGDDDPRGQIVAAQARLISRLDQMNRRITGFASLRLERDCAAARDLAGCRSPAEATAVWTRFVGDASQDYLAAFGELATLGIDTLRATVGDAGKGDEAGGNTRAA